MAAARKAGRKLASNVWVDGVLYLAGDSPEKAVADQITNPNAWDDGKGDESDDDSGSDN